MARQLLLDRAMLLAMPIFRGRISPVLDVARQLLVLDFGTGSSNLADPVVHTTQGSGRILSFDTGRILHGQLPICQRPDSCC